MERYWLTLFQETFLWIKNENGLIYNAKEFSMFHFTTDDCTRIKEICTELLVLENLYTTQITGEDMENEKVNKWIHNVIHINAGYLLPEIEKRPVSFKPVLKLFKDVEYYVWEHNQGTGGNIIQNIHELTFYFNKSNWGDDGYFKQTLFPIQNSSTLEMMKITSFINNSKNLFLSNINLVGDIFSYPEYNNLFTDDIPITIHITLQDFVNNIKTATEARWPDRIRFNLLIDAKSNLILPDISTVKVPVSVTALVKSNDEYMLLNSFGEKTVCTNIHFVPIYDGTNMGFFKSNVFTDQDDLETVTLSKREVFMRQATNMHHFGKLTIFPDGKVFADVNQEPLGTIDDSPYSLIYKEFAEGKSWLRTRNQAPCNECIYQWLCPSPSNYEIAIGRPNLCHVWKGDKETGEQVNM